MRARIILHLAIVVGLFASFVSGQSGAVNSGSGAATVPTSKQQKDAKSDALDLSVPESPGFTILGLTPQEVTRPTTPREFVTALLNGFDQNGNFQSGIAIDAAPYQVFHGNSVRYDDYKNDYWKRFFWRTQVSLATAKGASDTDKSARVGAGLHLTLMDHGDLNRDETLHTCQGDLDQAVYNGIDKTLPLDAFKDALSSAAQALLP